MVKCTGSSLPTAPHGEGRPESKTKNPTLQVLKKQGHRKCWYQARQFILDNPANLSNIVPVGGDAVNASKMSPINGKEAKLNSWRE
jgi:hypothetical protein